MMARTECKEFAELEGKAEAAGGRDLGSMEDHGGERANVIA